MSNSLLFYARNKKKGLVLVLIMALSVFAISLVITLIVSSMLADRDIRLSPLSQFSILRENRPLDDNEITALSNMPYVDAVFGVSLWQVGTRSLFGGTASFMPVSESVYNVAYIFERSNLRLTQGRMPEAGEMILHESLLLNWDTYVGAVRFGGFEVSGVFTGEAQLSFAVSPEPLTDSLRAFVLVPEVGRLTEMNQSIDMLNNADWERQTYANTQAGFETAMEEMMFILSFIIVLIAISISISVGALAYTMYLGRMDEFAILSALGYKKSNISKTILTETLIIAVLSWVIGQILTLVGLFIFNVTIFRGFGQSVAWFTGQGLFFSLVIVVLVVAGAAIPATRKLSKADLVSIIERR